MEEVPAGKSLFYDALLKSSLADDGRISSAEQQAILTIARKSLKDQLLQELEQRIAAHTAEPLPPIARFLPETKAPAADD